MARFAIIITNNITAADLRRGLFDVQQPSAVFRNFIIIFNIKVFLLIIIVCVHICEIVTTTELLLMNKLDRKRGSVFCHQAMLLFQRRRRGNSRKRHGRRRRLDGRPRPLQEKALILINVLLGAYPRQLLTLLLVLAWNLLFPCWARGKRLFFWGEIFLQLRRRKLPLPLHEVAVEL